MLDTSLSLLARLHQSTDADAWERLAHLYTPLIERWLGRSALQSADVDDLVQDVLAVILRRLPDFRHDGRAGSFRAWVRTITVNRLRDYWRSCCTRRTDTGNSAFAQLLEELEDPHSSLSRLWDEEHDRRILYRLLELIEPEFKPATWRAFQRYVIGGEPVDDVARALHLSVNAVFIAKSRVLQRLREESRGLVDDPPALSDFS